MPAKGGAEAVSELALIERIGARARRRPGTELGIGDDAALLSVGGTAVVTQDLLVEGVHFRRATTSPRDLGHKALAVNLSDIAAMGAEPVAAFVGLCLPPGGLSDDEADELYSGMEALAERHGVTVAGGDVTGGPALVLAVAAVGRAGDGAAPVRRSGGRPGDLLCVTGALGASAAGLLLLERPELAGAVPTPVAERLRAAHLRPEPRVGAGLALARAGARAMLDLSDGLGLDGGRLARASGARAVIELDALPLAEGVAEIAAAAGRDARLLAVSGGEDYELLAALPPAAAEPARRAVPGRLTPVGRLEEGAPGLVAVERGGAAVDLAAGGWEHDV
jgi:thiamine-monophosphate kinase